MQYRAQSIIQFDQAWLVLDEDDTEGVVINGADTDKKIDGIVHLFVEHDSDVNLQMRVPAPVEDDGSWDQAGDWKTVETIDADYGGTQAICSNFEYRFTTATAGARVFIGIQWEGVS